MSNYEYRELSENVFGCPDWNDLGIVMLNLDPIEAPSWWNPSWEYHSDTDPYVDGWVGNNAHVTLRDGLLPDVEKHPTTIKDIVAQSIANEPKSFGITPEGFCGSFELFTTSSYPEFELLGQSEADYRPVVVTTYSDSIYMAHEALSCIPHIDRWGTYTPHVTLAYVHADVAEHVVDMLYATDFIDTLMSSHAYGGSVDTIEVSR